MIVCVHLATVVEILDGPGVLLVDYNSTHRLNIIRRGLELLVLIK